MFLVNNFQYLGPFWSDRGCGNHQGLVSHQQCHYWDLHVTCTLSSTSTMEGKLVLLVRLPPAALCRMSAPVL